MFCKNCGQELDDSSKFCPYCGAENTPVVKIEENELPPNNDGEVTPTKSSALVLGILSLFFFGVIFGVIAISLSKDPLQKNRGAARILGAIGIISWAILLIVKLGSGPVS
ncbi:MAG: zinc-ribbon domain-containing protein [Bacilli bacterium]|jgi:uncharacterized membrane protein YvbJ